MRLLFISPTLFISLAAAQTLLTPDLDKFIESTLTSWGGYSGAGVAVVRRLNASWEVETKGYGVRGDGQKVDANTLFGIGSNTKLFNAISAGLLVVDESVTPRISFDTKVSDIIPGFELIDPIASKEATIVDLASHRTGLATHDFMFNAADNITSIVSRLKDLKTGARFRESFQYSNIGYGLLGFLPEVLSTKTKFAPFVKQRIFDALNMSSSTFSYDVAVKDNNGNVASGIGRDNLLSPDLSKATPRKLPFWAADTEEGSYLSGAGGIISNAKDMSIWLQTLMGGGKNPATGAAVIPPQVLSALAAPNMVAMEFSFGAQFAEPEIRNMFSPVAYGAGQVTESYRGHTIVGHSGDVPGFHSVVSRLPYDNIGVAVLTNDHEFGAKIAEIIKLRILDTHLGLQPFDWNAAVQKNVIASFTAPKPSRPANASLPTIGSIESFEGQYTAPGYGSTIHVCAFVPNGTVSDECQNKFDKLQAIVDPKMPTLTAEINGILASHLILRHWSGDIWNVSAANVQPTGDSKKPFWAAPTSGGAWTAEFSKDESGAVGFGLRGGFWGRGSPREPTGESVKERAEVYWTKWD